MTSPSNPTHMEMVHREIDELQKINVFTPQRAQLLKDRLTPSFVDECIGNAMSISDIVDLVICMPNLQPNPEDDQNALYVATEFPEPITRPEEPHEGLLFVTDWKAPWNGPRLKGRARVTVWHRQTVLCRITKYAYPVVEYVVLVTLEESGRPPTHARRASGGAFSIDAIRNGQILLKPPTAEQLAMLPPSARDIGESVVDREYKIPDVYARRGLTLEHTGGGCTGLVLEFTCGLHALVTAAEDASAPTAEHDAVDVGMFGAEESGPLEYRLCENANAAIAFLDELSAKYSPPDLADPRRLAHDALRAALLYIRSQLGVPPGHTLGSFPDDSEARNSIAHHLKCFGQSVIHALMERRGVFPRP